MYSLNDYKVELLKDSIEKKEMSDLEYFSNYVDYISNSRLKLINPLENGSPIRYLENESVTTPSLIFGSCIHQLILQPEEFELVYYEHKPSGKLGLFIEHLVDNRVNKKQDAETAIRNASISSNYYSNKLSKNLLKTALLKGRQYYKDLYFNNFKNYTKTPIIVSLKNYQEIVNCMDNFRRSNSYRILNKQNITHTKENHNEEAIFAHFKVTLPTKEEVILPFKAKLDNYSIDPDFNEIILNDIKTTSHEVNSFMGQKNPEDNTKWQFGSFQRYHYYRQIAVYMFILQNLINKPDYKYSANILAIESSGEYNSRVFKISNEYIKLGIKELKNLLCRIAYHTKYGFDQPFNKYE